jgi:hypothetical protein
MTEPKEERLDAPLVLANLGHPGVPLSEELRQAFKEDFELIQKEFGYRDSDGPMIDSTNPRCIRARTSEATASYYPESKRITLVADSSRFDHADAVLTELHRAIFPTDFEQDR